MQEIVDPGDLVVGDLAEDVGEPRLWIDAVQLRRFGQRVDNRCALAAPSEPTKR